MRYFFLLLLLCYLRPASSQAQMPAVRKPSSAAPPQERPDFARIRAMAGAVDSIYRRWATENNIPGLAYTVVYGGQTVLSGAFGYTDVERKTPATTASVFRIASMSKSFTTLAILKLRDEGKLRLDDEASRYIPELKSQKLLTTDAPPITIRHLLTHTAGFPEDNPWGDRQLADTDAELTELLNRKLSFSTAPGTGYEYSNLGITLLGRIIQKITGKPYQQYINEAILTPLGMRNTHWDYRQMSSARLALGYRWEDGSWKEEALLPDGAYGAMGGLLSSANDFARYMLLHLVAYPARDGADNGPVRRASIREAHFPAAPSAFLPAYRFPSGRTCGTSSAYAFGLGWMQDCEGRTYVGHSGGLPGFGSQWRIMPQYGLGVVALANRTYAAPSLPNLAVLDTLVRGAGLPRYVPPASLILLQRQGQLVDVVRNPAALQKENIWAENFFPDRSADRWQKRLEEVRAAVGEVKTVEAILPENALRGAFIIRGSKADARVFFTLTPEKDPLVQELRVDVLPRMHE